MANEARKTISSFDFPQNSLYLIAALFESDRVWAWGVRVARDHTRHGFAS